MLEARGGPTDARGAQLRAETLADADDPLAATQVGASQQADRGSP